MKKKHSEDVSYEMEVDEIEVSKKLKKLKSELKECQKEKKEYLEGWQRAKADFANLKKTLEEDKSKIARISKEDFLLDILPIIDSFDMAFADKTAWESVDKNWRIGVESIYKQLHEVLTRNGLQEYDDLGKEFDPNLHMCVENIEVTDNKDDNKILDVLQKGYLMSEIVVRPARVKVGKYSKKIKK